MKIQIINSSQHYNLHPQKSKQKEFQTQNTTLQNSGITNYSEIPFCAINNITPKKLPDVEQEKKKLLRQLTEMLDVLPEDITEDEIKEMAMNTVLAHMQRVSIRLQEIDREIDDITDSPFLSTKQKTDHLQRLFKEVKMLNSSKPKPEKKYSKLPDEKIDYKLLNILKNSILENEFGLKKVYYNYYKDLNNISTIEELQRTYPKIQVPPRPETIIAKKIEKTFTRDFYEEFAELCSQDANKAFAFSNTKVSKSIDDIAKKYNLNPEILYSKLALPIYQEVLYKYKQSKTTGFSIFHQQLKNNEPKITDLDIKLLNIDYDNFVLTSVRKHYLDSQKINSIQYSENGTTINLNSLSNSEYKFGKFPEKIRQIINQGEKIKSALRSYDLFSTEKLKDCVSKYADSKLSENENMLEHIVSFGTCRDEDRNNIIRFLQELDLIHDGEKTIEESLKTISKESIKPSQTEYLNKIEKQKAVEALKAELKQSAILKHQKGKFDDIISFLYSIELNDVAQSCAPYRPKTLAPEEIENCDYLIKLINKFKSQGGELNKNKLRANIINWNTYVYYRKNHSDEPLFKNAITYATDANNNLDINKAGQYINNSKLLDNTLGIEYLPDAKLLKDIKSRKDSSSTVIESLCKYSDYKELSPTEKSFLSNFIDNFDKKDPIDKMILKYIIENDYINCDTKTTVKNRENSTTTTETAICAPAKQGLLQKYKFPICLEFMEAFENALTTFASAEGSSGIKLIGRNNESLKYTMELKIKGHNDRLFSSKNNYYFDIFSEKGLH